MPTALDRVDAPEELFAHVCNGGALTQLAEAWGVRYSDLIAWAYATPARKLLIERALIARGEWEIERLLEEIKRLGLIDQRRAYAPDGQPLPIHELPADVAACISSISSIGPRVVRVRFHDKLKALELLGKKLKLFGVETNLLAARLDQRITIINRPDGAAPDVRVETRRLPDTVIV